ncbi:MAG: indolepyruvate oxidoreductase subunit beta [Acidobacteriota bacterium]|nr:indolepyruvate oxidoreductase subunit beta [Acidobacteriota bacterium]MDW3229812.1 indolepyruvate oxidoreductase subunit beta [Acidobacteriota bacterium]MDY0231803.1 indolepyruvate oxidoreductase subunit beta [Candidatus Saccharicenans sp.]
MKYDIILAGVGGQGILSIAFVLDNAALEEGLFFKQAEVHGMSQRGGAVQSHLRLSDKLIYSDLIPLGQAEMILSVEPLETLRYLEYLRPEGVIVSSSTPYTNIPDYPPLEEVCREIKKAPVHVLIESEKLAKEAGSAKAQNMVMLGAASIFLPLKEESLKKYIQILFERRGDQIIQTNLKALDLGRQAALASRRE